MTDLRSVRPPLLASILIVAVIAYAFVPMIVRPPASPLVGRDAPDLELALTSGERFAVRDHRGKVVVLELVATWSDLCDQQQKMIDEVVKKQDPSRVRIVGVVTGDSRENLDAWLAKHHTDFPLAFDEGDRVAHALDVNNVPAFVILAPSGKVSSVVPVGLEASELTKLIDRAR